MNQIFNFLIEPYQNYAIIDVVLEAIAVILGLLSVYFAKRDQIAVYPTGMLSTIIFVYILFKANLLGDMIINAYYFLVSIYGLINGIVGQPQLIVLQPDYFLLVCGLWLEKD